MASSSNAHLCPSILHVCALPVGCYKPHSHLFTRSICSPDTSSCVSIVLFTMLSQGKDTQQKGGSDRTSCKCTSEIHRTLKFEGSQLAGGLDISDLQRNMCYHLQISCFS